MTQNTPHNNGFTLIETVLYIALFVILISAVLFATYRMIESTDTTQVRSLVQNEAQFAIRKINWLLTGATAVSLNGSNLQITNPNFSGSDNPIVVSVAANKFAVQYGSGTTLSVTSDIAPVTASAFTVTPAAGGAPAQVEMVFTMQNSYYNETFTAKKLLR